MSDVVGARDRLHSDQGARPGEHPGRSRDPLIKVTGLAWLEFDKPDLVRAERFAHAFGLYTASADADQIRLRGTEAGSPCVILRRAKTRTRAATRVRNAA